jgi:hypothetical protein
MRKFPSFASVTTGFLLAIHVSAFSAPKPDEPDAGGWKLVSQSAGVTIHNRPHREPGIQEVKATGVIHAGPDVVRRVLEDTDAYVQFMPHVIESRVVAREHGAVVVYQRLSPPMMRDVDYTMRMTFEMYRADTGGRGHRIRWHAAEDAAVAEKNRVIRLKVNDGYWLLEPTANEGQTRATYWLHSDCGKAISPALTGIATRTTVPKIFDGLRKQVALEKYSAPHR